MSPAVAEEDENRYVFEKAVEFNNGDGTTSLGRVDLFYREHFILKSKQGTEKKEADQLKALAEKIEQKKRRSGTATRGSANWRKAMTKAFRQAKRYADAIPDEWPPFLIVCDVGHCFDPASFRISLKDLADEAVCSVS